MKRLTCGVLLVAAAIGLGAPAHAGKGAGVLNTGQCVKIGWIDRAGNWQWAGFERGGPAVVNGHRVNAPSLHNERFDFQVACPKL